jgi:DNA-binding CsgD family transcriptional regulator
VDLLEREPLLASLREFYSDASGGAGAMVFVAGDAGIGKSAVVGAFCAALDVEAAVHRGFCDALGTPRALGPLHDIARAHPRELGRLLVPGAERHELFTAFLDMIGSGPSVTVIEDAHWADAATLDLLLFVGRRIAALPAMVVVTYRAEEVDRDHPLRRVLGDLATARSVHRLVVPPLTEAAVHALAEPRGRDGARLHAVTGGNAFFVTEVLDADAEQIPVTVRDAVLARVGRLGSGARAVLDVVSLMPDRAEVSLVAEVADGALSGLDENVRSGMLVLEDPVVRFRHELARRVVEEDIPAARKVELHRLLLHCLESRDDVDPARLSCHADSAAEPAAVLRWAPAAARLAADLGAHREAAAHLARALRYTAASSAELRARLWEFRADESDRCGELADAIDASSRAVQLWREVGDVQREASVLARRTHMLWNSGRDVEAHESARGAVELLEPLPPGPVLAQAYAARAQMLMLAGEMPAAIAMGAAAIPLAEGFGDDRVLAWALNAVGSGYWPTDPDRAVTLLTAGLEAARRSGDDLAAAGVLSMLATGAVEIRRYDLADHWLGELVAWCTERDLDPLRGYGLAWQAVSYLDQGRWGDAMAAATEVADDPMQHVPSTIVALTVLGRLRARRGDPDPDGPLERAWMLAQQTGDFARLWPVAAARAESAALQGRPERIDGLVAGTYELAVERKHGWAVGELGYWLSIAGQDRPLVAGAAGPWALQIAGAAQEARRQWQELGCPYEAATARSRMPDDTEQLAALRELQALGAWPAAALLARRMHAQGIRGLPRRPRRTTSSHPAGLSERQADVLALMSEGLRNADIAARLHISPKTVDHHVSAVLGKLGVRTRHEAARWAQTAPETRGR